jgi:hypothetical protein
MKLTPQQRSVIRGMFGGKCAYCGCDLPEKGWHADHVEAVNRKLKFVISADGRSGRMVGTGEVYSPENERLDNLFPACAPCNIDKGSSSLEGWRDYLNERIVEGLRRNSSTFRHAERFGRVIIVPGPLIFWFEKWLAELDKRSAQDSGKGQK